MQKVPKHTVAVLLALAALPLSTSTTNLFAVAGSSQGTTQQALTPLQSEIANQRVRLGSSDVEDRREALVRLGSLRHPDASRVALSALSDPSPIIRATAAESILSLPANESVAALIPLLSDKEEFVRQSVAYALGHTRSSAAVAALVERLTDKMESVRGAAAVALGQIGDPTAITSLAAVLDQQAAAQTAKKTKPKGERNPFVLRAAARSLGQIGNRAAVPALILALQNENSEPDVRREAAIALGAIGDASALPALNSVTTASDPYLSEAAREAIKNISK